MLLYPNMKKETLHGVDGSCQISKRHLEAIQQCISIILQEAFPIEKIVLFGSCARSQSRYESDIDLLLIVKELPSSREIRRLKMKLGDRIGLEVDLKISTVEAFASSTDFFINNIKRDGVTVWTH